MESCAFWLSADASIVQGVSGTCLPNVLPVVGWSEASAETARIPCCACEIETEILNFFFKLKVKLSVKIGKYLVKLKARTRLSHALCLVAVCWPGAQSAWDNHALACITLPNIHRFIKKFTHRLSNKLFLIWLLTTPSHLKYVATLPCNLSLMAFFWPLMFHKVV